MLIRIMHLNTPCSAGMNITIQRFQGSRLLFVGPLVGRDEPDSMPALRYPQ